MMEDNSSRLAAEERVELDALAELPDEQIDTTDMPEVRNWTGTKRGLLYRPERKQLTRRCANHARRHARARKSG